MTCIIQKRRDSILLSSMLPWKQELLVIKGHCRMGGGVCKQASANPGHGKGGELDVV